MRQCPSCFQMFKSLGLSNHRKHCKGRPPAATPSAIEKWPFPRDDAAGVGGDAK